MNNGDARARCPQCLALVAVLRGHRAPTFEAHQYELRPAAYRCPGSGQAETYAEQAKGAAWSTP